MFKTEISIIIPVYRLKNYLAKCLDSILAQDFTLPFNVILVETNSDDGSDIICQEYEKKHVGKIYHFHYDSYYGISVARNLGLLHANGTYVSFVDGDDELQPYFLSNLYEQIKRDSNLQVVYGGYQLLFEDGQKKNVKSPSFIGDGKKALKRFYKSFDFYRGYCWGGLLKREFLLLNHLSFDSEMKLYEDMLFMYQTLYDASYVYYCDTPLYLYRQHSSSTMRTNKNWLSYHLKCLTKFKSYIHLNKNLSSYFSKVSPALKKQLKLDCSASNSSYSLSTRKLYKKAVRYLKGDEDEF